MRRVFASKLLIELAKDSLIYNIDESPSTDRWRKSIPGFREASLEDYWILPPMVDAY